MRELRQGLWHWKAPHVALPVEHVLATHGEPTDRPSLERALA